MVHVQGHGSLDVDSKQSKGDRQDMCIEAAWGRVGGGAKALSWGASVSMVCPQGNRFAGLIS